MTSEERKRISLKILNKKRNIENHKNNMFYNKNSHGESIINDEENRLSLLENNKITSILLMEYCHLKNKHYNYLDEKEYSYFLTKKPTVLQKQVKGLEKAVEEMKRQKQLELHSYYDTPLLRNNSLMNDLSFLDFNKENYKKFTIGEFDMISEIQKPLKGKEEIGEINNFIIQDLIFNEEDFEVEVDFEVSSDSGYYIEKDENNYTFGKFVKQDRFFINNDGEEEVEHYYTFQSFYTVGEVNETVKVYEWFNEDIKNELKNELIKLNEKFLRYWANSKYSASDGLGLNDYIEVREGLDDSSKNIFLRCLEFLNQEEINWLEYPKLKSWDNNNNVWYDNRIDFIETYLEDNSYLFEKRKEIINKRINLLTGTLREIINQEKNILNAKKIINKQKEDELLLVKECKFSGSYASDVVADINKLEDGSPDINTDDIVYLYGVDDLPEIKARVFKIGYFLIDDNENIKINKYTKKPKIGKKISHIIGLTDFEIQLDGKVRKFNRYKIPDSYNVDFRIVKHISP